MHTSMPAGCESLLQTELKANCSECCGLCCIALYFAKSEGFPADKEAGTPCTYLENSYICAIHSTLAQRKMKGCMAYDCFGAGQKVTQAVYGGETWRTEPRKKQEMLQLFLVVEQLHQMLWYLAQAAQMPAAAPMQQELCALIKEIRSCSTTSAQAIMALNTEEYHTIVTAVLHRVSTLAAGAQNPEKKKLDFIGKNFRNADLSNRDFSSSFLIATDLRGANLCGTNFLGADMRDTLVKNTDMRGCLFLTQRQINAACGNEATLLPPYLATPAWWKAKK